VPGTGKGQQRLLLATTSAGKIRELTALLAPLGLELVTPPEVGTVLEVEETGSTYVENARLKAQAYAAATSMPTLGEDSGLEIDALNGAPGIYSARFEGIPDGPVKNARILELLRDVPEARRGCTYVCAIVYVDAAGDDHVFTGRCPGVITTEPRGSGGFGFDPIMFVPDAGATMAELSKAEKNRISHRARAAQQLVAYLTQL
jgi:XTP/dITP diphosphohydrolase